MLKRFAPVVVAGAAACSAPQSPSPARVAATGPDAGVAVAPRSASRIDVPAGAVAPAPWAVVVVVDHDQNDGAKLGAALRARGVGVAFLRVAMLGSPDKRVARIAEAVRDLSREAKQRGGLAEKPSLVGADAAAVLVLRAALDGNVAVASELRAVVGLDGEYDREHQHPRFLGAPLTLPPTFPPVALLSHGGDPAAAQGSRLVVRGLEKAGSRHVYHHHVADRLTPLSALSTERDEVADYVAAFTFGANRLSDESAFRVHDAWGRDAPLTTEAFWKDDPDLIQRRPVDERFRAQLRNLYDGVLGELEPWPSQTYDAIDLAAYLARHHELGPLNASAWLTVKNARSEVVTLSMKELRAKRPVIVIGIDDEPNLFRMLVTYNVYKTYSWKPEAGPRPLLARPVGAFLYVPAGPALEVTTFAHFALTKGSFQLHKDDPWKAARARLEPMRGVLTGPQGCLQCHSLGGEGARAHHLRAKDGQLAEGYGLALEAYPSEVLHQFLFDQKIVADGFGVSPLFVTRDAAITLEAEVARLRCK